MSDQVKTKIPEIIAQNEQQILEEWIQEQLTTATLRPDLIREEELREQSDTFLKLLQNGLKNNNFIDINSSEWAPLRELLASICRSRTTQGFTPTETATFVFSFKQPLFNQLRKSYDDADSLADDLWNATTLIDKLGLFITEVHLKTREEVIARQQEEMFELSSPVVELWDGVLGLPVIGTLDSKRTQLVMESLLQRLAASQSEIAIIDITGVPTVDTLTAQHLLKTVNAAQLMGAECVICGIRPQIAQTMVHLGINLGNVITKSTMAGALAHAFKRQGLTITSDETK
ncbi:STAS domain-containing protein [Alteromonas pelagimontana]|uniref:STAS domain-containing protein n=1 Tax=Alteromonas pelagimontana TaxID=1858656 RepID=A0A6M4MF33_9ALTE|nr:STAS domain-containing protein [Alteromonas pelagimontana]QJR81478.1 STAS domain-containing protein [Alteromonas pelagimontana]